MSDPTNPYAALSLIVAPAVLTNASSILVLSTSNRLARAVDRARALATELDTPAKATDLAALRVSELDSAARRAVMLLGALRFFYASIGSFAAAALTSLVGAALLGTQLRALPATFEPSPWRRVLSESWDWCWVAYSCSGKRESRSGP